MGIVFRKEDKKYFLKGGEQKDRMNFFSLIFYE